MSDDNAKKPESATTPGVPGEPPPGRAPTGARTTAKVGTDESHSVERAEGKTPLPAPAKERVKLFTTVARCGGKARAWQAGFSLKVRVGAVIAFLVSTVALLANIGTIRGSVPYFDANLLLRPAKVEYIGTAGAPVEVEMDVILSTSRDLLLDDVTLSVKQAEPSRDTTHASPKSDEACKSYPLAQKVPPLDSKLGRLTAKFVLQCSTVGVRTVAVMATSPSLKKTVTQSITVRVVPRYVKCLLDAAPGPSPAFIAMEPFSSFPYMTDNSWYDEFKVIEMTDGQETNPVKAAVWFARAPILTTPDYGYEVLLDFSVWRGAFHAHSDSADSVPCEGNIGWVTHFKSASTHASLVSIGLLYRKTDYLTVPLGKSWYVIHTEGDRVFIERTTPPACKPVQVKRLTSDEQGSTWQVDGIPNTVSMYHEGAGHNFRSNISIGKYEAIDSMSLDGAEDDYDELPLRYVKKNEKTGVVHFFFLDGGGFTKESDSPLQVKECTPLVGKPPEPTPAPTPNVIDRLQGLWSHVMKLVSLAGHSQASS